VLRCRGMITPLLQTSTTRMRRGLCGSISGYASLLHLLNLYSSSILLLTLILQRRFQLADNADMEHARVVFHKNARKIAIRSILDGRTAASNEYLKKYAGQKNKAFRDGLATFLIEKQYAMVNHSDFDFFLFCVVTIILIYY
jgi:hypothetical protein